MMKQSIVAGGGVLYRATPAANTNNSSNADSKDIDIALIKRKGVWDLPKGKQDRGESIIECARREVSEELGIAWPTVHSHLGQTWHTYFEDGIEILKTTYWYAMKPSEMEPDFVPETREQIEQVQWVLLADAIEKVAYDNLRSILHTFARTMSDSAD